VARASVPAAWAILLGVFLAGSVAACGDGSDDGDDAADVVEAVDADASPDDGSPDAEVSGDEAGPPDVEVEASDDAAGPDEVEASDDAGEPDEAEAEVPADVVDEGGGPPAGCVEGDFDPYWGDLHSHTSTSDGEGSPAEAFAYARDVGGLDIMVVTDHCEQLYLGLDLWGECRDAADAANAPGTFVALCGFEYGSGFDSVFRSTGHNNVFFADALFPAVQLDFHDFYASLVGCTQCVGQYNHPLDGPEEHWNHYEYFADVDERICMLEQNSSGDAWSQLFAALDAGYHVSPQYNQDNHSANWGTANDNRSGFWLPALSRVALRGAMLARRTFSTQDKNAWIRMFAEGTCWMGSRLAGVSAVELAVDVEDADPSEGFATIELYGPGQVLLETHDCAGAASCTADFSRTVAGPTYFVARAIETDGQILISAPIWAAP
jgi:hypothetical protein